MRIGLAATSSYGAERLVLLNRFLSLEGELLMIRFLPCALLFAFAVQLLVQPAQLRADTIAAINKSFVNMSTDPLTFEASGTFEFTPGSSDIVGTIEFRKMVTLAAMFTELPVQHALFGEWDESWSLTKIGFSNPQPGVLSGFDPSEVEFGSTGTFDVDIEMLGPVPPGHSSRTDFTAEVPLDVIPVEEVLPLLEELAINNPGIDAVIDLIDPTPGLVVPVAMTSLHIPEPSSATLLALGSAFLTIRHRRSRRTACLR